jgi:hypothetical protein
MQTLHALQKVTAGIDVHRLIQAVTVLIEHDEGSVTKKVCEKTEAMGSEGGWNANPTPPMSRMPHGR